MSNGFSDDEYQLILEFVRTIGNAYKDDAVKLEEFQEIIARALISAVADKEGAVSFMRQLVAPPRGANDDGEGAILRLSRFDFQKDGVTRWLVRDRQTGDPARHDGCALVGLVLEDAKNFLEFLNAMERTGLSSHLPRDHLK